MNTAVVVALVIFFFILILVAIIVGVTWTVNKNPGLPSIGQTCNSPDGTVGVCAGDLVCSSQVCLLPVRGTCTLSSQCVDGSFCVSGKCVYATGHICKTNEDCDSDLCSGGICVGSSPSTTEVSSSNLSESCDTEFSLEFDDGDVDETAVIDSVYLNKHTLMLMGSGDIVVQEGNETRVVVSDQHKMRRLFVFQGKIYGLSLGKIYVLQSHPSSLAWGWSWIPTVEAVSHVSCTFDGRNCWIQNSKKGKFVYKQNEFNLPMLRLEEDGIKVMGSTIRSYIVIKPDKSIEYQGRVWKNVASAVLDCDDNVVVEYSPHIKLAVLKGEVVTLQ